MSVNGSVLRANLRSSGRRLIAAGIAIGISVAFIVAGLLMIDSFTRAMTEQAEAEAAGTDLVVDTTELVGFADEPEYMERDDIGTPADETLARAVEDIDQVASAEVVRRVWLDFTSEENLDGSLSAATLSPSMQYEVLDGRDLVESDTDLADGDPGALINEQAAEAYGLGPGDTLTAVHGVWTGEGEDAEDFTEVTQEYQVVGVVDLPGTPRALLTEAGMQALPFNPLPQEIRVVLTDPGATDTQEEVQQQIIERIVHLVETGELEIPDDADLTPQEGDFGQVQVAGMTVATHQQVVDTWVANMTGDVSFLSYIALGFGGIAVLVSALVITNTFQVLIASRQRTFGLLRAVGADPGQLRRATLAEGAILGLIAGLGGVLLGWAAAAGLTLLARATFAPETPVALPAVTAMGVGLGLGLVMTVGAALLPAIKAGRVSPMVALRPADVAAPEAGVSWLRLTAGVLLATAGAALTLYSALSRPETLPSGVPAPNVDPVLGLPLPLLGATGALVGFLGVLLVARGVIPPLVAAAGRLLAVVPAWRTTARLAGQNARQVPGRTTATASALLIGVTLVASFTIGAATAQKVMTEELADSYPVDAVVPVDPAALEDVLAERDITTVEEIAGFPGTEASADGQADGQAEDTTDDAGAAAAQIVVASAEEFDEITYRPGVLPGEGEALIGWGLVEHIEDEDQLHFSAGSEELTLTVEEAWWLPPTAVLISEDTAPAGLDTDPEEGLSFLRLTEGFTDSDVHALAAHLDDAATEGTQVEADLTGAYARAGYTEVIDMLLMVVLALLGASVVVAVIGVSNTLSLSVFERRREAALLRAVGMSRGAVGSMVSIESVLLAGVALVLGTGLGAFFGWAGVSSLVTSEDWTVSLAIPWLRVGALWVVTVLAALVAAWWPARSLAKTPPAAGLSQQ
ncbi:ABC transporter permease [Nesterenkonia alba]|uniref:ABC transporter permease n=1 Tax=Nesterenkonia alba TaxID=515814 RepID=UPI0012EB444B|nr:ABC transporter permease [Nesterenkonia alba]